MKKLIENYFTIPKDTKLTNQVFSRLLFSLMFSMIVCVICLSGLTWALFSVNTSSAPSALSASAYGVEFSISPSITAKDGDYMLNSGVEYEVTFKATGTASTGYVVINLGNTTYRTEQIKHGDTLTFKVDTQEDTNLSYVAVWGQYSNSKVISEIRNIDTISYISLN